MFSLRAPLGCALLLSLLPWTALHAQLIPAAASVGPVPGTPGTGLAATVDTTGAFSLADALASIDGSPDGSFLATSLDYPNAESNTLSGNFPMADFLGIDAATLTGTPPTSLGAAFAFRGYLAIADAGTYQFAIGSDDGFRLTIAGTAIAEYGSDRGFGFSFGNAQFEAAGLYPIELIYYANPVGESGLEFFSTIAGGRTTDAPDVGYSLVPTAVLYVPEPSTLVLSLFGVGGLGLLRTRRRR